MQVKQHFARVASQPRTLGPLLKGLSLWLRSNLGPWIASDGFGQLDGRPAAAAAAAGAQDGQVCCICSVACGSRQPAVGSGHNSRCQAVDTESNPVTVL